MDVISQTWRSIYQFYFYVLQKHCPVLQLLNETCFFFYFQNMLQCASSTCEPGFTCSSTTSEQCVRTYCAGEPTSLAYGHNLGNLRDIGNRRRYTCDYGPEYGVSVSSVLCKDEGQWSDRGEMLCHPFGNQLYDKYMHQDWAYPSNVTITTTSLNECVKECSLHPFDCLSVNYRNLSGQCHFSTQSDFKWRPFMRIGNKPSWTVVQKIFPVFMASDINNVRYQLTKDMAIARCLDLGTTIATLSDVTNAYNMGFFACRCGYVLDVAYALYYMRTSGVTNCGRAGLNYCRFSASNMYDVYCKTTHFVATGFEQA